MSRIKDVADRAVGKATESIINRLLKNAGVDDMIEHPKNYRMELYFEDDGMTLKVRKK